MPQAELTGGCQCGAVRFSAKRLGRASICHCRMCQKAFGGFFGPLVTAFGVTWTRGEPGWFESSNKVKRGFCAKCGTPLAYDFGASAIELAIGAFDNPEVAAPTIQVNTASKLSFFDSLMSLPVRQTGDSPKADEFLEGIVSHQHPDRDTEHWPPAEGVLHMSVLLTGGCQCGALRYALDQQPENVHVCHCRMCQKAVGGPFAVICPVQKTHFRMTRGTLAYFMSSEPTRRGFCKDCGTPMTFEYHDAPDLGVLVGTLDHPELAPPVIQYGNESRIPWYNHLNELPGNKPTYEANPAMLKRIADSSHQHPDHDTDHWVPGGWHG